PRKFSWRQTISFHQAISRTGFAINRNTCLLQSLYISINCPLANLKLRGKILRFYNGLGLQLKVDGEDFVKSLSDVHLVKLNILRKKRIIRWIRKESLPLRSLYQYRQMNKALIALACGGLAIGMTEFTMMGILPDIAKDLHIDIPEASNLIALYALGVVVGAPTLVALSGKYAPRNIFLFLMLLFFVFNGIFAIAPNKMLLLTSRFISGFPHGAFFGVGSVVAARLAKPGQDAQALSMMFTGRTVANLAGVPLGTYIGHHYSWRITYGVISLLGLITFLALYIWMPKMEASKTNNVLKQIRYFTRWDAWLMVAVIAIGTGGLFAWIS